MTRTWSTSEYPFQDGEAARAELLRLLAVPAPADDVSDADTLRDLNRIRAELVEAYRTQHPRDSLEFERRLTAIDRACDAVLRRRP